MSDERRLHKRVEVRAVVRMHFSTIGEFLQSQAENISAGGMQIVAGRELASGDLVGLEFRMAGDQPLIEGTAEVKWCRAQGEHFRLGVEFQQLDERSRAIIQQAVEHAAAQAPMLTEDLVVDAGEADLDTVDLDTMDLEPVDVEDVVAGFEEPAGDDLSAPISFDDAPAGDDAPLFESSVPADPWDVETADSPGGADFGDLEAADAAPASGDPLDFGDIELADEVEEVEADAFAATAPADAAATGFEADAPAVEEVDVDAAANFADLAFDADEVPPAGTVDNDLFGDASSTGDQAVAAASSEPQPGFDFDDLEDAGPVGADDDALAAADAPADKPAKHRVEAADGSSRRLRLIGGGVLVLLLAGFAAWGLLPREAAYDLVEVNPPPVPEAPVAPLADPEVLEPEAADPEAADPEGSDPESDSGGSAEPEPEPEPAPPVPPPARPAPAPTPKAAAPAPAPAAPVAAVARVTAIRAEAGALLQIEGDGIWPGRYRFFALASPPRIVVDLIGVELAPGVRAPAARAPVDNVRVGRHEDRIRIVLDMQGDTPFTVEPEGNVLRVRRR